MVPVVVDTFCGESVPSFQGQSLKVVGAVVWFLSRRSSAM